MGIYGQTIDIRSRTFRRLSDDQRILVQAVITRLSTKPGTYWTDPAYGFPLSDLVNAGLTQDALARVPGQVKAQLEQDERFASVTVTASTRQLPNKSWVLVLDITITPARGPEFSFTLAASALSVDLLTGG
jgi:phage baseplate assembly protein W